MGAFIASYFYNSPPVQTSPRVHLEAITEEEFDNAVASTVIDIEKWAEKSDPKIQLYSRKIQPNGLYETQAPKI